jgi:hypothetical protein
MAFSWVGWYSMTDEQYLAELERRNSMSSELAASID